MHFSKSTFPLWIQLRVFFFLMPEFWILGVGRKKKREGRRISDGNPDSLNCFCCLRYSASCNLYGPMPAWYLIHTWLLKIQAKGTAVLQYAREGTLSSSAKLVLKLRETIRNFKEIKRFQSFVRFSGQLISHSIKVGTWKPAATQQIETNRKKPQKFRFLVIKFGSCLSWRA